MANTGKRKGHMGRVILGGAFRSWTRGSLAIAVATWSMAGTGAAIAGNMFDLVQKPGIPLGNGDDDDDHHGSFCTATARALFQACNNEIKDDFFKVRALCINLGSEEEREKCLADNRTQRSEGKKLCGDQRAARGELCLALGEGRYDPSFDPSDFDGDFRNLSNPNRYFPLKIGNTWKYAGGDQTW